MAGFKGISWAPGQLSHSLVDKSSSMLDGRAGTYAVSRSIHYGLCLAFEGIRFFVKKEGGELRFVFLNLDHNLNRFVEGIEYNLSHEQKVLVPTKDELRAMLLEYLGHPNLREFMNGMAEEEAQGYLRPFTLDDEQSIGVTFPSNPVIRVVASRYESYLGEPFHGVCVPYLVRVVGANGNGRLKLGVNYLMSVKAVEEAQTILPNAGSALFLDDRPYGELFERTITEWDSSCCLIALKDGTFVKIRESNLILPSVTVVGICAILKHLGASVEERDMTYGELVERCERGEVVTTASIGTAGILNRCTSLLLIDNDKNRLGCIESDTNHESYHLLKKARDLYWEIYKGRAEIPESLVLESFPG